MECEKSCDVGQYLDYESCKCSKKLIDKLVEECSENIDGNDLIYNTTINDYRKVCSSCTLYIVLLVIFLIIRIGISCAFIYFYWYLKKDITNITNINANTETVIYQTWKWEISNILNIKNGTYYFFDDMINIKVFDSNLLKIDKKSYKNINIYCISYITRPWLYVN